jgi:hypothetical protein
MHHAPPWWPANLSCCSSLIFPNNCGSNEFRSWQTCLAAAHLFLVLFGLTNLYRLWRLCVNWAYREVFRWWPATERARLVGGMKTLYYSTQTNQIIEEIVVLVQNLAFALLEQHNEWCRS